MAAGTIPVETTGSGNTVTIEVQTSQAVAATDSTKIGLSNFNSSHFSVDANGFVSLVGGGSSVDSVGTQTGTNPIAPDGAGLITINGAVVAAGTNPVRSDGTGANTMAIEVQISQALAATDATKIGLCNFNSTQFSVDANGFVNLAGGGIAFDSITPNSGTNPIVPDGSGNVTMVGQDGITTVGSLNTMTITPRGAGSNNMFLGQSAGNLTLSGANNVGYGASSFSSITSGDNNTAIGQGALTALTNGQSNVVIGQGSATTITSGASNTVVGRIAFTQSNGDGNVSVGTSSMQNTTGGGSNVAIGSSAMQSSGTISNCVGVGANSLANVTADDNSALGQGSLQMLTSGTQNTGIGKQALQALVTGSANIALGYQSGTQYTGAESNNITIGNIGTIAESGIIRLGTSGTHTAFYLAGTSYPVSTTINQLLYSSAANTVVGLATANSGVLTTNSSGVPSIDTTNFVRQTTGMQVKGNNTNTAPPAGFIGEQINAYNGSGVSLTTNVTANVTSIALTAGVWDIAFIGEIVCTGTSTIGRLGISTTNNSYTTSVADGFANISYGSVSAPIYTISIPQYRVLLSGSVTYYLNAFALFTTGAATGYGRLSATRVG